jgi:hypothetical protein
MKYNDPMPLKYYNNQKAWFNARKEHGEDVDSYLRDLYDYYVKHESKLVNGKAPKRPDRRMLNWTENKRKKARKESGEVEVEEVQRPRKKRKESEKEKSDNQIKQEAKDMWESIETNFFKTTPQTPMTLEQMTSYFEFFTERGFPKRAGRIKNYYEKHKDKEEVVNEEDYQRAKKSDEASKNTGTSYKDKLKRIQHRIGRYGDYITHDDPIPEDELKEIIENADDFDLTNEDIDILYQYQESHNPNTRRADKKRDEMKGLLESAFGGNVRVRQALLKAMNEADGVRDKLGEVMDLVFH